MKSEPKAFASLSSGLLARKGAARPAMRPQGFGQGGSGLEDLGWNDMGYDTAKPSLVPVGDGDLPHLSRNPLAGLTPVSPVHDQQAEIEQRFTSYSDEDEEEQEEELGFAGYASVAAAEPEDDELEEEPIVSNFATLTANLTPVVDEAEPRVLVAEYEEPLELAHELVVQEEHDLPADVIMPAAVVDAHAPLVPFTAFSAAPELEPTAEFEPELQTLVEVQPIADVPPIAEVQPIPAAAPPPVHQVVVRSEPVGKGKAAFTLRLDPSRHLKLRLACAVTGRSAQQLVTRALDELLASMPELEAMAERAPAERASRKG